MSEILLAKKEQEEIVPLIFQLIKKYKGNYKTTLFKIIQEIK